MLDGTKSFTDYFFIEPFSNFEFNGSSSQHSSSVFRCSIANTSDFAYYVCRGLGAIAYDACFDL